MNYLNRNKKRIMGTLIIISISAITSFLGYACSPVRFSQGSDASKFGTPKDGKDGQNCTVCTGNNGANGADAPGLTTKPIIGSFGTFNVINLLYTQKDSGPYNFLGAVDINNFKYDSATDSCSYDRIVYYQADCDLDKPGCFSGLTILPGPAIKFSTYDTGVPINPVTSFTCGQAKKAFQIQTAKIQCEVSQPETLSEDEKEDLYSRPALFVSPKSYMFGVLTNSINRYADVSLLPKIMQTADCRCFYRVSTVSQGDTVGADVPAIPAHCAAHFSEWN